MLVKLIAQLSARPVRAAFTAWPHGHPYVLMMRVKCVRSHTANSKLRMIPYDIVYVVYSKMVAIVRSTLVDCLDRNKNNISLQYYTRLHKVQVC